MTERPRGSTAPDGGWGWFVCLGTSLITLTLRGMDTSFGLLFADRLRELKIDSTGASVIMSVLDSTANFSGLFVGPLMKRFSYRKVAVFGSLLSCTGLVLTSRADSMVHVICTYGVLTGLGTGFAVASSFVALNSFFDERRGRAIGFSMAGTTLAMMSMPQVIRFLLDTYDFQGTMLILGGWALHSVVGALLLRPIEDYSTKVALAQQGKTNNTNSDEAAEKLVPLDRLNSTPNEKVRRMSVTSTTSVLSIVETHCIYLPKAEESTNSLNDQTTTTTTTEIARKTTLRRISEFLDLDLLKDSTYLNIVFGLCLYYVAEMNFKLMNPFFLSSVGLSKQEVATCLSLTALTDVVARLCLPTVFDKLGYRKRRLFWVGSFFVGIGRSVFAEQPRGAALVAVLLVIGFLRGATLVNLDLTVSESCALEKLPTAFGIFMVSKGISIASMGPVVGYVRDYSGSYKVCIHAMTAMIFACFFAWSIEFVWTWCRRGRASDVKAIPPRQSHRVSSEEIS